MNLEQVKTIILSLLNKLKDSVFQTEITNLPEVQKVEVINSPADVVIPPFPEITIPEVKFDSVIKAITDKIIPLDETATKKQLLKELQAIKTALNKPKDKDRSNDIIKAIERLIGAVLELRREDKELDLSPIVNEIKKIDTTIDWSILEDVITQGEVKVKINAKQFENLLKSLGKSISIATGGGSSVMRTTAGEVSTSNPIPVSLSNASINGSGVPVIDSYTTKAINLAAGANQSLVTAPGANKQIWVYGLGFTVNVAGTVSFQDEDDTAISGIMPIGATGGMTVAPSGNFAMPLWKVATNKALEVDVVTSELDGFITYSIVSI